MGLRLQHILEVFLFRIKRLATLAAWNSDQTPATSAVRRIVSTTFATNAAGQIGPGSSLGWGAFLDIGLGVWLSKSNTYGRGTRSFVRASFEQEGVLDTCLSV